MEYNKNRFYKSNDKRVLHKVRKRWVVVSLALLATLGGKALASHVSAHADVNNNNDSTVNTNKATLSNNAPSLQSNNDEERSIHNSLNNNSISGNNRSVSISQAANNLHRSILRNSLNQNNSHYNSTFTAQQRSNSINMTPKELASTKPLKGAEPNTGLFDVNIDYYNSSNAQHPGDVNYALSHDLIKDHEPTSDFVGQPFDIGQYLHNFQKGYRLKDVIYDGKITPDGSNVPNHFIPGVHQINIEEYDPHQYHGTYSFRYEDKGDYDLIVSSDKSSDYSGQPFDPKSYVSVAPEGYTLLDAIYNGKTYTSDQLPSLEQKISSYPIGVQAVDIEVLKNPSGVPEPINITYRDSKTHNIIGRPNVQLHGHFYQHFNDIVKNDPVPAGYTLDPNQKLSYQISNQVQNVTLYITKKAATPTRMDHMYVEYLCKNVVVKGPIEMIDGADGTQLDLDPYFTSTFMPNGYKNPSLVPGDPYTYNTKNNLVKINVQPQNPTPTPSHNEDTMTIEYLYNGQQVRSSISVQGSDGSSFNVNPYMAPSYIPGGYDNPSPESTNPTKFISNGVVKIDLQKKQSPVTPTKTDTMTINYYYNGQPARSSFTVNGSDGSAFDVSPYLSPIYVPSGYTSAVARQGDPTTFVPNGVVNIDLYKKNQPSPQPKPAPTKIDTMYVKYMYHGQQVNSSIPVTGNDGDPFDIHPYLTTEYVPTGYDDPTSTSNDPTTYVQNGNVIINLQKQPSNNPSIVNMNVEYMYDHQQIGQSIPVSGINGAAFNASPYLTTEYLPVGYNSPSLRSGDPTTYVQNGKVIIDLQKKSSNPLIDQMNVEYMYNHQQIGQSIPISGFNGDPFSISPYLTSEYVPAGYISPTPQAGDPSVFIQNGKVIINVNKRSTNPSIDQMTVRYMYNGRQVDSTIPIDGIDGDSFNIKPFLTTEYLPSGYISPTPQAGDPTKYVKNGQVIINLQKVPSSNPVTPNSNPTIDQMTVRYMYNGQQIGSSIPVSGVDGSPFYINPYLTTEYVPSGFMSPTPQFGNPEVYTPDGQVIINLQKQPAGTPSTPANVPTIDHMIVKYMDNGQQIGPSIPVSGINGTAFDITPYMTTEYLPSGYVSPVASLEDPDVYIQNGVEIINVSKMKNRSNNVSPNVPTPPNHSSNQTPGTPSMPNNNKRNQTPQTPSNSNPNVPSSNGNNVNPSYPNNVKGNNGGTNNGSGMNNGSGYNANEIPNNSMTRSHQNGTDQTTIGQNGTGKRLPQTGETSSHDKELGTILLTLGMSVMALGKALDRRRRYNR